MSIQHVGAVLTTMPELTRTQAFVLIAIADGADRDTGWCFTTVESMARAARTTRRSAFRALRLLVAGGYVRNVGKAGRASSYRVLFDFLGVRRAETELYPDPCQRVTGRKSTRDTVSRGGDTVSPGGDKRNIPPNNPLIGVSVSSPGITRPDVQNARLGKGAKKMPTDDTPRDLSAERTRQLAALRKLQ